MVPELGEEVGNKTAQKLAGVGQLGDAAVDLQLPRGTWYEAYMYGSADPMKVSEKPRSLCCPANMLKRNKYPMAPRKCPCYFASSATPSWMS